MFVKKEVNCFLIRINSASEYCIEGGEQMKRKVFKTIVSLTALFIMAVSGTYALADDATSPSTMRLLPCANCNGGLVKVTREETDYHSQPCDHGWMGEEDVFYEVYLRVFMQCNRCGWGYMESETFLYDGFYCSHDL